MTKENSLYSKVEDLVTKSGRSGEACAVKNNVKQSSFPIQVEAPKVIA